MRPQTSVRAFALLSILVLFAAGCASKPEDRISKNRALYDSLPAATQQKVSAGEVDVGFTAEVVELALGKPGRTFTRSDASGESQVWVYYKRQSRVGFGIGVGGGSFGSGVSGGVGVSSGGDRSDEEAMRVILQNGKVTAVEKTVRK